VPAFTTPSLVNTPLPCLFPDVDAEEQALIFIHGMDCNPAVYNPLALEFQQEAAKAKYPAKMWVAFPEFPFDAPNPITISHYVKQA